MLPCEGTGLGALKTALSTGERLWGGGEGIVGEQCQVQAAQGNV